MAGLIKNKEIKRIIFEGVLAETYEEMNLEVQELEEIIVLFLKYFKVELSKHDRISLRNFGSFYTRNYGNKHVRNPKTNLPVWIGPRRRLHFKASPDLLEYLRMKPRNTEKPKKKKRNLDECT